jgi:anti-anti-sigma factor
MSLHTRYPLLELAVVGEAAVVRVLPRTLDEATSQAVGEQLLSLTDAVAQAVFYLDLGHVAYLTSAMLEKLLTLHKKLRAAGRRLHLQSLTPFVYEVFQTTRLNQVLDICRNPLDPASRSQSAPC